MMTENGGILREYLRVKRERWQSRLKGMKVLLAFLAIAVVPAVILTAPLWIPPAIGELAGLFVSEETGKNIGAATLMVELVIFAGVFWWYNSDLRTAMEQNQNGDSTLAEEENSQ